jgi:hypothetical protein
MIVYCIFALLLIVGAVVGFSRNKFVKAQLRQCGPAFFVTDVTIRVEAPPGRWTMDRPSMNRILVGRGYAHVQGRGPISTSLGWRWHFWATDTRVELLTKRSGNYVALRSITGISPAPTFRMGVAVVPSAGTVSDLVDALRYGGFAIN